MDKKVAEETLKRRLSSSKADVKEKKKETPAKADNSRRNSTSKDDHKKRADKVLKKNSDSSKRKPSSHPKTPLSDIYERVCHLYLKNLHPKHSLIATVDIPNLASMYDNVHAAMVMWATSVAMLKHYKFSTTSRRQSSELMKTSKKVMMAVLDCFEVQIEEHEGPYCKHFPGIDPMVHVNLLTGKPMDLEQGHQIKQSEGGPSKVEVVALLLLAVVQMQWSGVKLVQTLEHSLVLQNLLIFVQATYLKIETDIETAMDGIKFEDPTINISTIAMIKGVLDAYHTVSTNQQYHRVFGLLPLVTFQYEVIQTRLLLKHVVKKIVSLRCLMSNASTLTSYPSFAIRNPKRVQLLEQQFDFIYNEAEPNVGLGLMDKDRLQVVSNLAISALFSDDKKKADKHADYLEQFAGMPLERFYKLFEDFPGTDKSYTFYSSQSLLIIYSLLYHGYLAGRDIDSLSMASGMEIKEKKSQEVHVVVVTESEGMKAVLKKRGVMSQSMGSLVSKGFKLFPDQVLLKLLSCLACETKKTTLFSADLPDELMQAVRDSSTNHNSCNIIQTSQLYSIRKHNLLFVPKMLGKIPSYLDYDMQMFCDSIVSNIKFVHSNWISHKHPLFILPLSSLTIDFSTEFPAELDRIFRKLKTGFVGGVKVKLVKLAKNVDPYLVSSLDILATHKNNAASQMALLKRISDLTFTATNDEDRLETTSTSGLKTATPSKSTPAATSDRKKKSAGQRSSFKMAFHRLLGSKSEQVHRMSTKEDPFDYLVKASTLQTQRKAEEAKKERVDAVFDINNTSSTSMSALEARASADKVVRGGHKEVQHMLQQRRFLNAKWKHLDLNWMPEQIVDFIANDPSSMDMVVMSDDECVGLLRLFDLSNNFMEKARIVKKLYNLRGLNWWPFEGGNSLSKVANSPGEQARRQVLEHRAALPPVPPERMSVRNNASLQGKLNARTGVSREMASRPPVSKDLRAVLVQMYRISSCCQTWWMARYTGGLLGLHIEGLTTAMTSIISNHQRQVIIGCSPNNKIVLAKPKKDLDIITLIQIVSKSNPYIISLLQEVLVYSWMACQFNPSLLEQFVCLDLQAIYQAMLTDISFRFSCNDTMAAVYLACLSPYELKCFVEVTLRGEEMTSANDIFELGKHLSKNRTSGFIENIDTYLQPGVWLKRRSLDGVLTRLPEPFISRVWFLLQSCKGLMFDGHTLRTDLTNQYSDSNLNFVAILYRSLRSIKSAELRELYIEAIFLLSTLIRGIRIKVDATQIINVTEVINAAVNLFLKNQHSDKDFRMLKTCCSPSRNIRRAPTANDDICKIRGGGYCFQFYDSAPTGEFGTMSFFSDAIIHLYTDLQMLSPRKSGEKSVAERKSQQQVRKTSNKGRQVV